MSFKHTVGTNGTLSSIRSKSRRYWTRSGGADRRDGTRGAFKAIGMRMVDDGGTPPSSKYKQDQLVAGPEVSSGVHIHYITSWSMTAC